MLVPHAQWCVLAFTALANFTAIGAERDLIFGAKVFYDSAGKATPEMIYVAGTLVGKEIANKNNTIAITCYSRSMECLTYSIEQIGEYQLSRLGPPDYFPIIKWDKDQVVASGSLDVRECSNITISISRKTQSALWIVEPRNSHRTECKGADTEVKKWIIDDPQFWKKTKTGNK